MARLNVVLDSDDEFPDVSILLAGSTGQTGTKSNANLGSIKNTSLNSKPNVSPGSRRQRPLKLGHVNTLSLPLVEAFGVGKKSSLVSGGNDLPGDEVERTRCEPLKKTATAKPLAFTARRSSPRKAVQGSFTFTGFRPQRDGVQTSEEDSSFEDDLSDFIVNDSAGDIERPRKRSPRKKTDLTSGSSSQGVQISSDHSVIDLTSPKKPHSITNRPETPPPASPKEPFDEDCFGQLKFSPPPSRSPHRRKDSERPLTPPCSPPKPDLQSPSKRFHRIPPSPHRPSIDAFWSQEVINDWNDQHSPRKAKSPRKLFSVHEDDDEAYLSPSTSPRKSPTKTPAKRDKAAVERKKAFDEKKDQFAVAFLKELDEKVAGGRVAALAESAGGVKVIWSKKLNSTAGRANWKRETLVSKGAEGVSTKIYRHHASIELAEKVIDDEERLVNVLAHEYCHLANFMISGVKNNPHGKEFKEWAAKTTRLFGHRNITVTTKHSYAISYKYIWACTSPFCGLEYKRHSKSIDPLKHSCGACKGKLVQIQPAPRKGKNAEGEVAMSAYQSYVKSNSARIRQENPGIGLGEVMKKLGEEFRGLKARKLKETEDLENVGAVDVIVEDLDGSEKDRDASTDEVVRKLDFLSLS